MLRGTLCLNMTKQKAKEIASEYGFDIDELYVHIPSSGKALGPHIELDADFSHTEIPSDMNRQLMELVDIEDKQPATKHHLESVL